MIVNQQNQNRPLNHTGWPCGHDILRIGKFQQFIGQGWKIKMLKS
jgi:hypothetical protein